MSEIILAEGTDREIKVHLKPHVGKDGRAKDNKLLQFVGKMQDSADQMSVFATEEFDTIVGEMLDLEEKQMEQLTKFELIAGFQQAMPLRLESAGINTEEVQAALKK